MECDVIITYRCNAHCQMCSAWRNPSRIEDEITPEIIDKIPFGCKRLNITEGESALRKNTKNIIIF